MSFPRNFHIFERSKGCEILNQPIRSLSLIRACVLNRFSRVWLCGPMDYSPSGSSVHEFSRQEYWSGLPFPSPGDLPDPEIKQASLMSPASAGRFFTTNATWKAHIHRLWPNERADLKRLYTVWFQLQDILEKAKPCQKQKDEWLPGTGREEDWTGGAQVISRYQNYCVCYCHREYIHDITSLSKSINRWT